MRALVHDVGVTEHEGSDLCLEGLAVGEPTAESAEQLAVTGRTLKDSRRPSLQVVQRELKRIFALIFQFRLVDLSIVIVIHQMHVIILLHLLFPVWLLAATVHGLCLLILFPCRKE